MVSHEVCGQFFEHLLNLLAGPELLGYIVLGLAVSATRITFWRVSVLAGLLLLFYALWVGFAAGNTTQRFALWCGPLPPCAAGV